MRYFEEEIAWVGSQQLRMERLVEQWCLLNSGTYHTAGVERCAQAVIQEFAALGKIHRLPLPAEESIDVLGRTISAPLCPAVQITASDVVASDIPRVLLCIHLDTVFGENSAFQHVQRVEGDKFNGPGVADAKGGIVVMLLALECLMRSRYAKGIAWEVLLNTDEEIGSVGSLPLLQEAARRNDVGLLFEPAWPDGMLTGQRKGSGNFSVVITGRSAHAGRDSASGRNAMHAAARFIVALNNYAERLPGTIVNVGRIEGGGPSNIVPDLAIVRFNVRVETAQQQHLMEHGINWLVGETNRQEGFGMRLHGCFTSPPRLMEGATLDLFDQVATCGKELGMVTGWRASGGVSDGNKLAAAGLPNVDTLGVCGGNLHTSQEYMLISSLSERAKLSALFLLKLASGQIPWPNRAIPSCEAIA